MSDSLIPWLCEYIISMAETYGAQLSNIPPAIKKKKVQIKEFLTFPPQGQEETYVWAIISDKQFTIPVKFTREAMVQYSQTSYSSTRFTQNKGAIFSISKYQPIHTRVPLGINGKPTAEAHLALECNIVSLLGSSGECTFGNPKPITSNPDVKLWSDNLHHDGGAGNILKQRKLEREAESKTVVEPARADSPEPLPAPPSPVKPMHAPTRNTRVTDMESYKARWRFVERNPYLREPPQEEEHPSRSGSEKSPVRRSESVRSATPLSTWEQSPGGVKESDKPNSSIAPPTPGQRTIAVPESSYEPVLGRTRAAVARKVPRPNTPEERREMTGPTQVLVPNSDTSQSQPLQAKYRYKDLWWVRDVLEKTLLHKPML